MAPKPDDGIDSLMMPGPLPVKEVDLSKTIPPFVLEPLTWVGSDKPAYPAHGQIWFDNTTNTTKYYDGSDWVEMASGETIRSQIVQTFDLFTTSGLHRLDLIEKADEKVLELYIDSDKTILGTSKIIKRLKATMGEREYTFLEKELMEFLT